MDTTQDGHHAFDYLTSFNRTETDANPCTGVPGCDPASFMTLDVPLDPSVVSGPDGTAGTADDIEQAHGHFTLFGGTLNGVSGYIMVGSLLGNSQTSVTITFTPSVSSPVIAWGGHIADRQDWGTGNSAIQISGAPFHMRVIGVDGGGGNQDRSLHNDAVFYPGDIVIVKDAQPDTTQAFAFTALGPSVADFTL